MRAAGLLLALALAACGTSEPAAVPPLPEPTRSPVVASPPPSPPVPVVQAGDGDLQVVPGGTAPSGPGTPVPYVVQVEGGIGVDPVAFAAAVDATLADPRSWGGGGRRAMQRVDDVDEAEVRIALTSPRTTDQLCAPLDTGGYYSCANGAWAVLNAARWIQGAPSYAGHLEDYRAYVVNHEVGHALGFGHADCPGRGQVAPVMLQQTKGLEGCLPGPWPYP